MWIGIEEIFCGVFVFVLVYGVGIFIYVYNCNNMLVLSDVFLFVINELGGERGYVIYLLWGLICLE